MPLQRRYQVDPSYSATSRYYSEIAGHGTHITGVSGVCQAVLASQWEQVQTVRNMNKRSLTNEGSNHLQLKASKMRIT